MNMAVWMFVLIGLIVFAGLWWYFSRPAIALQQAYETQNIISDSYGLSNNLGIRPGFGKEVCASVCNRQCFFKYPELGMGLLEGPLHTPRNWIRKCHCKCQTKYCNELAPSGFGNVCTEYARMSGNQNQ